MTNRPSFRHPIRDSSTLSISSPHINSCQDVAEYLKQCNIACHVTPNYTVVHAPTDYSGTDKYITETGCQIKLGTHHPYLINPLFWTRLRNRFKLDCAYLEVEGKYKGCIYDYLNKTQCPSALDAQKRADTQ